MHYDDNVFRWKRMEMIRLLLDLEAQKEEKQVFENYIRNKLKYDESKMF